MASVPPSDVAYAKKGATAAPSARRQIGQSTRQLLGSVAGDLEHFVEFALWLRVYHSLALRRYSMTDAWSAAVKGTGCDLHRGLSRISGEEGYTGCAAVPG